VAKFANDELAARSWLRTIPGLPVNQINMVVPEDNSTWSASGFVQIAITGDSSNHYYRLRRPVITASCWAVKPGNQNPDWVKASNLAETIALACWDFNPPEGHLVLPSGYGTARILQAEIIQPPRRAYGDEGDYAKYTVDFQLTWNPSD